MRNPYRARHTPYDLRRMSAAIIGSSLLIGENASLHAWKRYMRATLSAAASNGIVNPVGTGATEFHTTATLTPGTYCTYQDLGTSRHDVGYLAVVVSEFMPPTRMYSGQCSSDSTFSPHPRSALCHDPMFGPDRLRALLHNLVNKQYRGYTYRLVGAARVARNIMQRQGTPTERDSGSGEVGCGCWNGCARELQALLVVNNTQWVIQSVHGGKIEDGGRAKVKDKRAPRESKSRTNKSPSQRSLSSQ
ncbi:hypothetical protein F4779DRAFT_148845 [Xylariaceae sp. FL0662B]|nr:hypothetical protein F4779DRAFT_148845 [Xylariaceae sp. FL0662B]